MRRPGQRSIGAPSARSHHWAWRRRDQSVARSFAWSQHSAAKGGLVAGNWPPPPLRRSIFCARAPTAFAETSDGCHPLAGGARFPGLPRAFHVRSGQLFGPSNLLSPALPPVAGVNRVLLVQPAGRSASPWTPGLPAETQALSLIKVQLTYLRLGRKRPCRALLCHIQVHCTPALHMQTLDARRRDSAPMTSLSPASRRRYLDGTQIPGQATSDWRVTLQNCMMKPR